MSEPVDIGLHTHVVLLPGLDGTARLFDPFIRAAPSEFHAETIPLPNVGSQSYEALAEQVAAKLPSSRVVLIAESFSGPLAVLIAAKSHRVAALVLCATFLRAPVMRALRYLPDAVLAAALVRFFMTGRDAATAEAMRRAVSSTPSQVIAERVREVLRCDVSETFRRLNIPILFVRAAADRLLGRRGAKEVGTLNAAARLVDVSGPHLLLQTNPSGVWQVVQAFISEVLGNDASSLP